jgi:hypothetical protein
MESDVSETMDGIAAEPPRLIAYRLHHEALQVEPARVRREWMEQTVGKFATRCLPMMIANQAGWVILNRQRVRLTWNGGPEAADVCVEYPEGPAQRASVVSHFGTGIVTWINGLLFRTPSEFDLYVRGPTSVPKDGIYALDGIVETDWSFAPFTMNWQLLRPRETVTFDEAEPIAMISPQRKNDLEQFVPMISSVLSHPEVAAAHQAWESDRADFIRE